MSLNGLTITRFDSKIWMAVYSIDHSENSSQYCLVTPPSRRKRLLLVPLSWLPRRMVNAFFCSKLGQIVLSRLIPDTRYLSSTNAIVHHVSLLRDVAYQIALASILDMIGGQQGIQFPIYTFKPGPTLKKDARIESMEPYFRKGFIFHHKNQTDFVDEFVRFSPDIKGGTKDILDALSFQPETWERLSFLGGGEENSYTEKWKEGERRKIERIKNHSRRRGDIVQTHESNVVEEDPGWEWE